MWATVLLLKHLRTYGVAIAATLSAKRDVQQEIIQKVAAQLYTDLVAYHDIMEALELLLGRKPGAKESLHDILKEARASWKQNQLEEFISPLKELGIVTEKDIVNYACVKTSWSVYGKSTRKPWNRILRRHQ